MRPILRKLRGALGTAVTWAVVWALGGFAFATLLYVRVDGVGYGPFLDFAGGAALTLGLWGLASGALFSGALATIHRRRSLGELKTARVGLWGGFAGFLGTFVIGITFGCIESGRGWLDGNGGARVGRGRHGNRCGYSLACPEGSDGDRVERPETGYRSSPDLGARPSDLPSHRSEVAVFSFGRARRTYVMVRVRAIQRADKASFDLRILQRPCGIYSRYWLSQFLGIFTGRSRPGRSHAHDQRA